MCPVCHEPLVVFELEGVEVDHCAECRGTWLDDGELETLVLLAGIGGGAWEKALAEATGRRHGRRRCPRCLATLRVVEVSGVEIDRCPHNHGLWFDQGEIRKVISSFESGEGGAVARFFAEILRSELEETGTQEMGG